MPTPRLPSPRVWPALTAALISGLFEWAALCRSRAADLRQRTHRPGPAQAWALALPVALAGLAAPADAAVVISQVYGGGGNTGATYRNDFIELFNNGTSAASVTGWSVQYASAAGTSWTATPLAGTIPPGGYLLVQQAAGTGGTTPLPTPDATGSIAMSGTAGKVALVNGAAALTGVCPTAGVIDFVGYGSTASCSEGSSPTAAPSNTLAVLRAANGCTDSNVNSADFAVAPPNPRNSVSTLAACGIVTPPPAGAEIAIYSIQGSGSTSPLLNQVVLSHGVVTKLTNNGFFMQDLVGDANPATSDGIFVFTGTAAFPAVAVGNLVQVAGTVVEFNTGAAGNADTAAHTVTQLSSVTAVTLQGTGLGITPTAVTLPEAVEGDLERCEGMLVTLAGPFTVAQNFFQGRFGQLTLAAGGRLETPTNRFRPGAQANALADENARRRIILDDGTSLQNPRPTPYLGAGALPRAGDTVGAITGVIDYGLATSSTAGFGDTRIHPTVAPVFATANPRSAAPEAVGGNIRVASFNVLNYFTTFGNGATASGQTGQGCSLGGAVSAANCRGADSLAEFQRQRAKIVEAMAALNADVLGLMEIQNNGSTAVQNLVDALNARVGAGTYAAVALPARGTGSDAIRVAMIYKPSRMTPVGAPLSDTDAINNRPTLAQPFVMPNGERFSLLVNHFKSKGSCPAAGDPDFAGNNDIGDGQGCWNALRLAQAQRLRTFVAQVQAAAGSNDVLLIGDFNAYAQEDPIFDLVSSGYSDQVARFGGFGYSYVFDGAAGRLDHAIANASMATRVNRVAHWHINADETALADYNLEFKAPLTCTGGALCPDDPYAATPFRSSDHDPVLLGLNIYKTITATAASTSVTGTAGDDIIISGAGRRTITGGGGNDQFVFSASFAGGATITDFQPGLETISLRAVLQALGISSTNPIGQGYVRCAASGADAMISIDPDAAGAAAPRPMVLIRGRGCSVLASANFVF
ncbi:Nuclease [Rubrivivax sp. A210]|uniref:ExeM/NucH family extracellular endonuclease n=1 Tax=Rubrivivax sp. A210 TaxID=2772301 RepID=UPI0019180111|nr:ExeM/NucH family extracellular endonuclease [Rubrivivax sp. A210]CAD5371323.1 Nuclease [Rubrivivax sp. A210]